MFLPAATWASLDEIDAQRPTVLLIFLAPRLVGKGLLDMSGYFPEMIPWNQLLVQLQRSLISAWKVRNTSPCLVLLSLTSKFITRN